MTPRNCFPRTQDVLRITFFDIVVVFSGAAYHAKRNRARFKRDTMKLALPLAFILLVFEQSGHENKPHSCTDSILGTEIKLDPTARRSNRLAEPLSCLQTTTACLPLNLNDINIITGSPPFHNLPNLSNPLTVR